MVKKYRLDFRGMTVEVGIDELHNLCRKAGWLRLDDDGDDGWKTINGTHVEFGDGEILSGPDNLKNWASARKTAKSGGSDRSAAKRVSDCKSHEEIRSHMQDKYGIKVSEKFGELDLTSVQRGMKGIEDALEQMPNLPLENIEVGTRLGKATIMASNGATIFFNPNYFKDEEALARICAKASEDKWSPPNSTPESIAVHECGHCVEYAAIMANDEKYPYWFEQADAWNSHAEGKSIVSEACKNFKKTDAYKAMRNSDGKKLKNDELVATVSRYATKTPSETVAEAFADCYSNGEKANSFSKEIVKVAEGRASGYKKAA